MLRTQLSSLATEVGNAASSELEHLAESIPPHQAFLRNNPGDDPRTVFFLETIHRYFSRQHVDGVIAEIDPRSTERIRSLREHFYTDGQAQFLNLTRALWIMKSFSGGIADSALYWFHKIGGLDQKPFKEWARVKSFGVSTYQSPGLEETIAIFDIGYTMLLARATQAASTVMLYGPRGAALNRHLSGLNEAEIRALYRAREALLTAFNIPVVEIDIPKDFMPSGSYIPQDFAIGRAVTGLSHDSRDLNASFIDHLREAVTTEGEGPSIPASIYSIIEPYLSRTLEHEDYAHLITQLKKPLEEFGLELLALEGVHDISDIILRASDHKNPLIKKIMDEHSGDASKKSAKTSEKRDPHYVDGLQQRAAIWKRLLSAELPDDIARQLSAKNPNFEQVEGEIVRKYRERLEKAAGIWRRLLPSNLMSDITSNLGQINDKTKRMEASELRQWVQYYMGEIIHMMRPLLADPSRAYLKLGNKTEEHWDNLVYSIFENPRTAEDAFWLFGEFFQGKRPPLNPVFISGLYSHFTYLGDSKECPRRFIYTSYGPAKTHTQISNIPLVSDTPDELLAKFQRIAQYDPDQILRMVVGAMYCFMNPGDGSAEAMARYSKNMRILSEATDKLPKAYQISVRVLNPMDIPEIIDSKIRAEYEVRLGRPKNPEIDYIHSALERFSAFEALVRGKQESMRKKAIPVIKAHIESLDSSLELAVGMAEGLLTERYREDYKVEVSAFAKEHGRATGILDRLEILANYFLSFYCIREKTDPDRQNTEAFLGRMPMAENYDLDIDETLRLTHHDIGEIIRKVTSLRERATEMNSRYANLLHRGSGSRARRLQGAGLNEYLTEAVETVMRLGYRKQTLDEIFKKHAAYVTNPITQDVSQELSSVIGTIDQVVGATIHQLMYVVDREDIVNFLRKRFDEAQKTVKDAIDNPGQSRELFKRGNVYPEDEIYLLKKVDSEFAAMEERYLNQTREHPDASDVKFPHELQQDSALRNTVTTLIGYYQQVIEFINRAGKDRPTNPAVIKYQAPSKYSITPEQAVGFFGVFLRHLKSELGNPYFDSQRAGAQAILNPA